MSYFDKNSFGRVSSWILVLLSPYLFGFGDKDKALQYSEHDSLILGERLEYRVHYGFINAGEAVVQVDENIHEINNRPCYKVDVYGRTKGFFDMVTTVRDNWGTYLDTTAIVSQMFYQSIKEGKYRKKEVIEFDQIKI